MLKRLWLLAALIPIVGGCGGSGIGSGMGRLTVRMADAPLSGVTAFEVTIGSVQAHVGNAWVDIVSAPITLNLLQFAEHDTTLGSHDLPPGDYTQVRLFVTSATVTDGTGTHDVVIPSDVQTGVKLDVDYTITADNNTEILLDFNLLRSLHLDGDGTYRLDPVIPVVVLTNAGTISGTVMFGTSPAPGAEIDATYAAGAAFAPGTLVNGTMSQADGTFKIWALPPGTYTLNVTWTDPATSTVKTATLSGVVVTTGTDTAVGVVTVT
ncbi:MAG: DUF4382 domain-containing protein [Fimbriimonas ginsengisoli]|uniref:DUF4382 domain-containing protein n=1 Tax=Fimbriimonas ginsengisoli TaxID=1005039 RepID=A0A931LTM7_FIMGI|nr:DUF4382 domain-containing protein [Fimbriimonas ginsengisoli]